MRVYVSGAISSLSISKSRRNFDIAIIDLMINRDIQRSRIVNPLNIPPFLGIGIWSFYMIADIFILMFFCSHIALQENWVRSRGARIEKRIAKFMGKKVIKLWIREE